MPWALPGTVAGIPRWPRASARSRNPTRFSRDSCPVSRDRRADDVRARGRRELHLGVRHRHIARAGLEIQAHRLPQLVLEHHALELAAKTLESDLDLAEVRVTAFRHHANPGQTFALAVRPHHEEFVEL